jgi:hypothetical protein
MEFLRALAVNGIPIQFKQVLYYWIIVCACLSMFRTTRWWAFFVIREFWRLGLECWINYFLFPNYHDNDAVLRMLLNGTRPQREPMSWGEMSHWLWGYKTGKLRKRNRNMHKEAEVETHNGLVVPNGERVLDEEDLRVADCMRRRSWGIVEYVVKQHSGSVDGNGHARGDSQGSFSGAIENSEDGPGRNGKNGSIGRKKRRIITVVN